MKISRVRIKGFQQFHELDLDLTYPSGHPKAGEPLDKVCFIGRNGTGKSTLLRLLQGALQHDRQTLPPKSSGWCAIKLALADTKEYLGVNREEVVEARQRHVSLVRGVCDMCGDDEEMLFEVLQKYQEFLHFPTALKAELDLEISPLYQRG